MILEVTVIFHQAHPWFKDVEWNKLYEMEAAFRPEVNGELDTQNFLKFDEVFTHNPYFFFFFFGYSEPVYI